MKILLPIFLSLTMLLVACGKSPPKAEDIAAQMQELSDRNNGDNFLKIMDVSISDFYEKDEQFYVIVDIKAQYLTSKAEHIKKLKEENKGNILNGMRIDMLSSQLGNFEKGEIRDSKGEHIRVLRSENGWVIDPN